MDILKVKVNNQWVGIPAIKGDKGEKGDKGDTGDPAPAADITSAVDTWLGNHISNPDSPPLDRTLSSNVSAAPADMVGDLKTAVTDITGVTMIQLTPNGYIYTAGSIGSAISLTPTTNNAFSYAIVPAVENDIFCINGTGLQNAYLWTFIDDENKIITRANINTTGTDLYITAPENSAKLVINSTTESLGKCFKGESITKRINDIDVVGNGKQHKLIAGVIRNSGNGWEFIIDSGHQGNMNCLSVSSNSSGQIVIDYSGINATKVISLLVAPDETFAARGYLCGCSVGDDKAYLEVYKYAPSCVSGLIDCNNSGEITVIDNTGDITSAVWNSNNTMTVNHKNVGTNSVPIATPYHYSTTIPRLYSKSGTSATFQFLKISNGEFALADEVKGNLSFAFTRMDQESLALIKQDANNVIAANGNFWFIGIFQTD